MKLTQDGKPIYEGKPLVVVCRNERCKHHQPRTEKYPSYGYCTLDKIELEELEDGHLNHLVCENYFWPKGGG